MLGDVMNITVGGLLITSGIIELVITVGGTIFVAFAYGMSDAPQDKMNWTWPGILALIGVSLILAGKYSGL